MDAIRAVVYGMIKELVRKKDFYILLIFMIMFLTALSMQCFFNIEGISRYIKDLGYSAMMFFSLLIAIPFSAKQIPSEIENQTIYPMLAKPISRDLLILGKFLGSCIIAVISFSILFLIFITFNNISGSAGHPILLLQTFLFGILLLCLVCALAIFFSTFMTVSAAITLSCLLYFLINGFADALKETALLHSGISSLAYGVIFYLIPHFDFFDLRIRITHNWEPLPAWIIIAVTTYANIYITMLLYFAGTIFKRKDL